MAINIPQKPQIPATKTPSLRNGPMTRRDRMEAMADEQNTNKQNSKIGFLAIFVLMGWGILSDIIGIIILFIGLDDFFILDILNIPVFIYFHIKNVDKTPMYVPTLIEIIPWIGALPMRTVGILGVIVVTNWPDSGLAKIYETFGMIAKKINIKTSGSAPKTPIKK